MLICPTLLQCSRLVKWKKTDGSNVLRLPLPANVVQQWQVLQQAVGVTQPSISTTNMRPQTAVHHSGNGCVTVQVQSSPNGAVSRPRTPAAAVSYSYKVHIINPSKKSYVVSRYVNKYSSKFTPVNAVRVQLIEEFKDQVPDSLTFQIGHFEGSQQAKISLVTNENKTYLQLFESYKIDTNVFNSRHLYCKSILCSLQQLP